MSDRIGSGRPRPPYNLIVAVIFAAIGAAMGYFAYATMEFGTSASMGPGYFPVMLSIVLVVLSIGVGFTPQPRDTPPFRMANLRAIGLVLGAPLFLAATIRPLGMLPSLLVATFAVSFASRFATLTQSILLSAGFTAFSVVVFRYLLNMPIPIWGWLIRP